MNCFLCHLPEPANDERIRELQEGRIQWSATATLARTGLVEQTPSGWQWNPESFTSDGLARPERLAVRDPKSTNCGLCHGQVHFGEEPLALEHTPGNWTTEATGQVFSPQRISASAVNLAGKQTRARPWDVHAERLLGCTDCHPSVNNPAFSGRSKGAAPGHLQFDARRPAWDQYLFRPSHHLAKGHSAQATLADNLDGSMRRCDDCHRPEPAHDWLPFQKRHMDALACEACHIPHLAAPAYRQVDWTVLVSEGRGRTEYRGAEGNPQNPSTLIHGYRPVLLPRTEADGTKRLFPHNVITSWYWVAGEAERPVSLEKLNQAFFLSGRYHPDVIAALDDDGNGVLETRELVLDRPEKVEAIKGRLEAIGVSNPKIRGQMQPYSLHHGVVSGRWATRECNDCHASLSRMTEPFALATYVAGGVKPQLVGETNVRMEGPIHRSEDGRLEYHPSTTAAGIYIAGHDRARWLDAAGGLFVLVVLGSVSVHTVLRIRGRRGERAKP
jgi:hypothetical protein